MTTVRQLITDAYRESGITPLGETPDADEQAEGLRRLNVLFKSFLGNELGEKLNELNYGPNANISHGYEEDTDVIRQWHIPKNTRVFFNLQSATTLWLDPNPDDGSRFSVNDVAGNFSTRTLNLNANGRKIEGAGFTTLTTNSVIREWFYRSDLGEWVRVTDLTDNDESPFPVEFDDFVVTMLAMRLNPRFGAELSGSSVEALRRARKQFRARYRQKVEVAAALALQIWPLGCTFYPWYNDNTKFGLGR